MITVVFAIRNRPRQVVENCLNSLRGQDCKIIVVDYGSTDLSWYPEVIGNFVRAGNADPDFNKARALNIGFKLATTPYVVSSDIDNVFDENFIEEVKRVITTPKTLVLCQRIDIQKDGSAKLHPPTAFGCCFGVDTHWMRKVRGYDEGFRNWGKEDDDMYNRAIAAGYTPVWIGDKTRIFHQYHEPASKNSLKDNIRHLKSRNTVIRNDGEWGELL